jgi:hypothetical protein
MRGGTKVMPSIFSSENVIATTMKFTWMIHTSFAIMRQFFHKVTIIFNTLLPTSNKMLYTSAVKFPSSTLVHITKPLFQIGVICKNGIHIVHPLQDQRWLSEGTRSGLCAEWGRTVHPIFVNASHVRKLV